MEITVLGCGSSAGTPVVGCSCPVCTSGKPRNQRSRASVWVQHAGKSLLIDTTPDLRSQALRENLSHVDAVLYTHAHADHLNGIDDLRAFCYRKRGVLPVFGNDFMLTHIRQRFAYTLLPPGRSWEVPVLELFPVAEEPFDCCGVTVTPIPVWHGKWPILGYRIADWAYITDVSDFPPSSVTALQGLEVLMIDCLRYEPHPTHLSVEQALQWARVLGARHTWLIHMTHDVDYDVLAESLPPDVSVAYDGLRLTLEN